MGGILGKRELAPLVLAGAMGDREAFTRLVNEYRQTMYATAIAVMRNEDDALDAIQDTLLILWEKLDTLRDPGSFKTWMTQILVNRCRDVLRSKKREVAVEEPDDRAGETDLDTPLDVGRVLSQLSQEDRLILQLFYFEDMSVRDIAKALSLSSAAVRMRLTRGRRRFLSLYDTEAGHETK